MPDLDLKILLRLIDKATKPLKNSFNGIKAGFASVGQSFQKNWALFTIGFIAAQRAMRAIINLTKEFIQAADAVEQYQVRMKVLLGTVEEGNQVFRDMKELAGQVPKTYDEIMASATDLAAVVKNGSREIKKLMPIIVDLSAGTGMSVREVTGQMIRMYSAGAAAADMFRERGVSAALGFMPGQSVSAEDTMKQIIDQWEDGSSKFAGASEELAKTFTGQVSMMDDAWFNFRANIGAWITESPEVIAGMNEFTEMIKAATDATSQWAAEGGLSNVILQLQEIAAWLEITTNWVIMNFEVLHVGTGYVKRLGEAWDTLGESVSKAMEIQKEQVLQASMDGKQAISQKINEAKMAAKIAADDKVMYAKDGTAKVKVEAQTFAQKEAIAKNFYSFMSQTANMAASENKKYAGLAKAVSIGQAIISTAQAVTNGLAMQPFFPVGIAMGAMAAALGAAQVAIIAGQSFHSGGVIGGSGEVPITALSGEGVLSRRGMAALGGPGELNALNAGGGIGGVTVNIDTASFREDQDIEDVATMLAEVLEEQRRARV